ncbi:Eco57I restriction-modification methylase domain-containing protein [Massilia sp. Leaf139]|uniref:Eco57I restriction-modification methylase domain-containing protein n=1 Tax=Massilia sp. Leaf139 TaxID=1736272 RepID=UPI0006FCBC0D|nr:Eco57I restriction-modification methylase domain-containing protein [Massilia sp. Leaf139]KQQ96150.1 hypothetical protein ASF77_21845 [Massilia sp. Leaf139]
MLSYIAIQASKMKDVHLASCQIETPHEVVDLAWGLAREARERSKFKNVIDFGAGDCRFALRPEYFESYLGIERDCSRFQTAQLPPNARVVLGDALEKNYVDFDLCIGNPPYVRHHHLDKDWRSAVLHDFAQSGVKLKATANAFVLFLTKAILSTKDDGLVVQVIPYEWVTRPSALELRNFIKNEGWSVTVLRFAADIFPKVLTTASITIIDKANKAGLWRFGIIHADGAVEYVSSPSGSTSEVLKYTPRSASTFALRGLSPGGQEIFVLTEEERLFHGLSRRTDVVPAITSLRNFPSGKSTLDEKAFIQYYVEKGRRCWLIQSHAEKLSAQLSQYLLTVQDSWQKYSTCTARAVWYRYKPHSVPELLIASGFIGNTPKVVINKVKAVAVGSVYAVFSGRHDPSVLHKQLMSYDFRSKVVSHANNLNKIEVNQLNSVLEHI